MTRRTRALEDGDIVDLRFNRATIYDWNGHIVQRDAGESRMNPDMVEFGNYRHFMQKEIREQARRGRHFGISALYGLSS